jgi:hypothetical protein
MAANLTWEAKDRHQILCACVGYNFGPNPESRIDDIRLSRAGYGRTIARRMMLGRDDVVVDIGSGCGFVGRAIAPVVRRLHCCDISADFLAFCAEELSEFPNVSTHRMHYADFSVLAHAGINRAYSSAVWIHFNFYDLYHYLNGLRDVLPVGGQLYFDYADPEGIEGPDKDAFMRHAAKYKENRESIFGLLNLNSLAAIKSLLGPLGYELRNRWHTFGLTYSLLVERVR